MSKCRKTLVLEIWAEETEIVKTLNDILKPYISWLSTSLKLEEKAKVMKTI